MDGNKEANGLQIQRRVIEAVIRHAGRELPGEACGYLAQEQELVTAHYALTNADDAADHFSMLPEEQFEAVRRMRYNKQTLRAVYHSHPSTPARPSVEDLRLAHDPGLSYVIVSLAGPEPEVRSFRIRNGIAFPEPLEIIDEESDDSKEAPRMETTIKVDAEKNCRGIGCPMNMVHAKVELARLRPGQVLALILDNGPPINNVPGSVQKEGHRILDRRRLRDGSWRLLIEKA